MYATDIVNHPRQLSNLIISLIPWEKQIINDSKSIKIRFKEKSYDGIKVNYH